MPFDPDKYLASSASNFDPDKYLGAKPDQENPEGPPISEIESAIRGGVQGFPFVGSYADEGEAALRSFFSGKKYTDERDMVRGQYKAAEEANPGSYLSGSLTTGVLGDIPKAIPLLGQAYGAVEGGVYGLGASEADLTKGDVGGALKDTGTGAAIGAIAPKVLQYGGKALKKTLETAKDAAGNVGLQAGRVLTGVPEEKAAYYLKNRADVNSAKDLEEIKSLVDSGVSRVSEDLGQKTNAVKAAKENVKELKQTADDAFLVERERLSKTRPPEEMAESIEESIQAIGKDLSRRSAMSFDELQERGVEFRVDKLTDEIDDVLGDMEIGGLRPSVGPAAAAYDEVSRVKEFVSKLGIDDGSINKKGGEIPILGTDLKRTIQMIDEASKSFWDPLKKNSAAAAALADVRVRLDKVLKKNNPEYKEVMAKIAPDASFYNGLTKLFSDPDKIKSVLKMASNTDSAKGREARLLLKKLDQKMGTEYSKQIDGYLTAQNTLKSVEGLRATRQSLPETSALEQGRLNIVKAEDDLANAKLWAEPFQKLGPANTESMLKQQMFGRGIEGRRALDELGEREGENFTKMLRDTATRDSFLKDSTAGSRKTNLGGMIGKGSGFVFGESVGGAVGATVDKYGGRMYKKTLDTAADIQEKASRLGEKYRHVFEEANSRKGGVAVTHHLLMQTDPEYREKMNEDKEK